MDLIQKIVENNSQNNKVGEVRKNEDHREFERQVEGLMDLYNFLEEHPDESTKKILKFMPPVDTQVLNETVRRIREKEEGK